MGDIEKKYKEYADALKQYGDENNEAVKAAYDAWQSASAAAETARAVGAQGVRKDINDYLNEGYSAVDAMIQSDNQRIEEEQKAAEAQKAQEENAARWTGLGQLANSVANLVGVGGFNAVNQQYQDYSQDWMKTAKANWEKNRARIDNMRNRQRDLQLKQVQLRMNGGATLANFDAGEVQTKYNYSQKQADAARDAAIAAAGTKAQTDAAAAEAVLTGGVTQAKMNESARQHNDDMALKGAYYGLKRGKDGWEVDPNSPITKAARAAGTGRRSGGSSKNTLYYYNEKGQMTPVTMTTAEYNTFIEQSYSALKGNDEFEKAYRRAATETEKKSIIYQFAIQDPARRAVLSQYSYSPEDYVDDGDEEPAAPAAPAALAATGTQVNPRTGLGYK